MISYLVAKFKLNSIWPPFWPAKLSKTAFCQFSTVFGPRRAWNVVRFKFLDQIWNPLVISSLQEHFLLKLSVSDLWSPIVILEVSNGPRSIFIQIRSFRCQIRNQRPKRHKMGCIAEKKWCSQPRIPYQQRVALSLNLCNIRSCFASITCRREVQLLSICSQYMSQSAHIFSEFYFVIPGSRSRFGYKNSILRPQTLRPCQHEKCSN